MDYLRSYLPRRGDTATGPAADVERQRLPEMVDDEQPRTRRFPLRRPQLPSVFTRESDGIRRLQRRGSDSHEDESPKTPRFTLGLPVLPATHFRLPNLSRTWTRERSRGPSLDQAAPSSSDVPPRPSIQRSQTVPVEPEATHIRPGSRTSTGRRFVGVDPAEMHLADLAETGRRRQHRRHRSRRTRAERERPKKFLFCFPWIKSRRVRRQVLKCFVSGLFLLLMLGVYLALSITKNINSSEFTILLILIILFTTIFFCHGLIRLCMIMVKRGSGSGNEDEERALRPPMPEMFGPGGYAIPRRPIRVVLARDEEAAGIESEAQAGKINPPAYGIWRESVRVDPNRIYWQRNDQPLSSTAEDGDGAGAAGRPVTANRPPSYASDDGVEYAVEARPRSMAPTALLSEQLPVHPSEAGRQGNPVAW